MTATQRDFNGISERFLIHSCKVLRSDKSSFALMPDENICAAIQSDINANGTIEPILERLRATGGR